MRNNKKKIRVSFVIPAYNVQEHIGRTLDTVFSQTADESDYEVVVVNDGSTDNTLVVVESKLRENRGIVSTIVCQDNQGVSIARNSGIENSNGDYIVFLDGDDEVTQDLVKSIISITKDQSPAVIVWGATKVDGNSRQVIDDFSACYTLPNQCKSGCQVLLDVFCTKPKYWIWTCNAAYKRKILSDHNIRFFPGCMNGEDQEFVIKAFMHADHVHFIQKNMAMYIQHEASISHSTNIRRFDVIDALLRSYMYLKDIGELDAVPLIQFLRYDYIIGNFINYSMMFVFSYAASNQISILSSIRKVRNVVHDNYPSLITKIRSLYKWQNIRSINKKFILRFWELYIYYKIAVSEFDDKSIY